MSKTGARTLVLALLCSPLLGLSPAWAWVHIEYLPDVEQQVFELTNEVRQEHYLMPLMQDTTLINIARAHSDDMLERHYFSHVSPDGKSIQDRVAPAYSRSLSRAGENIWGGHGYDYSDSTLMARVIVDSWMASPGHRANILNPNYNYMGVGVSVMGKEMRATQNFIETR